MTAVLAILQPLLDVLLTEILIPIAVVYLLFLAQKYLGVQLDDAAEGKLKRALETGWKKAMDENFDAPSIETVVNHVETIGAKKAVKRLKLSHNDLKAIAPTRKVSAREKWLKDAA